ncbi:DUF4065 domain-containing protein [Desulfobulbus rhabdoformis]|uniref:Panacea domain-containing protein n=1 Tax=Desulfobulbus rhabdoformis TaxID=34032 RepID=UPI0019645872|nr:type II toxin-antitoxin system antitoxin SocA domain-containing protein [Desulfobulbus rhabdoformis]MBM9616962.1 DUF4065 domain-containing protein [Desulfobulbus rhabdoformis]
MKVNAIKLAGFILSAYPNVPIYPMKLQKLAYYAKVWSIVANKNFIDADFERWDYGPVNREIYSAYREYSKEIIPCPSEPVSLEPEQEDFIKFVLDNYIDQSAVALSIQTHNEDPWINTDHNGIISEREIINYYSKQNFAKNFERPNYKEGPFYVLKTNSWHSFTMDMDSKEASFYESYPSYDEFVQRSQQAKSDFKNLLNEFVSKSN